MRERAIASDPSLLQQEADFNAMIRQYLDQHAGEREADTIWYTIPMVFHVLHNEGPENISDAQILDQVAILNRDYAKLNTDTVLIVNGFDTLAANVRIRFRLATKDPNGNCTNGIDRIRTNETFVGDDGSKLNPWFQGRYLNVWTCADMENGVAGYAYYPAVAPMFADGVIIRHDYVGSIGTSSVGTSRALTHEIGHYLNLAHPWGSTNDPGVACGDDAVEDTPNTKGWNFCPAPAASNVCDSLVYENYQNYMDYSYCSVMFTKGQAARMRAALVAGPGARNLLWSASNLAFTGTDDASYANICAPMPGAYASDHFVCTGTPVTFVSNTTRAMPTSWNWQFPGGNPSTSTDINPTVTYSTPGWKSATLTVTNASGSNTAVLEHLVLVSDGVEIGGALAESFPDSLSVVAWPADNVDSDRCYWQWNGQVGHNGTGCIRLNAYDSYFPLDWNNNGDNKIDELVSPSMDLDYLNGQALSFWYAYATRSTDLNLLTENLKVYSSIDCGRTWTVRATLGFPEIVTGGIQGPGYLPAASEWTQKVINLPSSVTTNNVRFKFVYTSSGASNDLFIDDVNILGTVGLSEPSLSDFSAYPNPTTGTLTFNAVDAGIIELIDLQGRRVTGWQVGVNGQRSLSVDLAQQGIATGVYLARYRTANGERSVKVMLR